MRISTVKKSNGHSILRAVAYINARKFSNSLTGKEHNFSKKSGVIETGFFMPHGIKTELSEEQFYNHIENNSHASTNIIAYSSIAALPPEISKEEQVKLVEEFCKKFTEIYGTSISFAVHEADNLIRKKAKLAEIEKYNLPVNDEELKLQTQNNHVHFVIPYCKIEALTEKDLTAKRKKKSHADTFKLGSQVKDFNPIKYGSEIKKDKPDLMNIEQNFLQFMREKFCVSINNSLEKNNRIERYTHKSYKNLGLKISATVHEGEMVKNRVASGKKMSVNEYNKIQKTKQQSESDYLNFINIPLPKELAYKILSGEKLAEKELFESLKLEPKTPVAQVKDLLKEIEKAGILVDEAFADQEKNPLDLQEKLSRLKEVSTPQAETLSEKLERLKQKQAEQKKSEPTYTPPPRNRGNDFDF